MHMRLLDRPPAAAPGLDHLRALEAESIHTRAAATDADAAEAVRRVLEEMLT